MTLSFRGPFARLQDLRTPELGQQTGEDVTNAGAAVAAGPSARAGGRRGAASLASPQPLPPGVLGSGLTLACPSPSVDMMLMAAAADRSLGGLAGEDSRCGSLEGSGGMGGAGGSGGCGSGGSSRRL